MWGEVSPKNDLLYISEHIHTVTLRQALIGTLCGPPGELCQRRQAIGDPWAGGGSATPPHPRFQHQT